VRGCLFVLVVAAALIGAIAWFAAEPVVDTVVRSALEGSGVRASSLTVTATSDPPPKLILGRADSLTIDASDLGWRTLHATRVQLTLDGVDLFGRTVTTIHGTIEGAEIAEDGSPDPIPVASIALDGPADEAAVTITVERAAVRAVILAAIQREFGTGATDVQLVAPNVLRLTMPGATIEGTMVIASDGLLALSTRLGEVTMLRVDPAIPLQLRSVSVVDGGLRFGGVLDMNGLLHG